ncbi:MAG: cytochrome c [Rhodocyclaceae bacterium]|nr:cytochrome c [Rhodocyclaceae bacterium]
MKNILLGVLLSLITLVALATGVAFSGVINIAADAPHEPWMLPIIDAARERSIDRYSEGIPVPVNFTAPENVRRGAGNYEAMCAGCHLRPGESSSEIRAGLYPQPPNLAEVENEAPTSKPSRQFWIIKHGIKASGMPAWSQGGMKDPAIWDLVGLLQQLPKLSKNQYRELVETSEGHSHDGVDDHSPQKDTMKTGNMHEDGPPNAEPVHSPKHGEEGHHH